MAKQTIEKMWAAERREAKAAAKQRREREAMMPNTVRAIKNYTQVANLLTQAVAILETTPGGDAHYFAKDLREMLSSDKGEAGLVALIKKLDAKLGG